MRSSSLDDKHGRTTSGVACHHRLWAAQTVGQRRALHAIIAFGHHIQSNDVGRGMPSLPLGSTHGRTTSGVACHYLLWATHTVERRRAWHDITALGQHTQSKDVCMACNHHLWAAHTIERRLAWHAIIAFGQHTRSNDVGHGMPSSPLGSTHGRTTSGVACHRRWAAHTVERCRTWHTIIAFGHHTRSATSGVA